MSLRLRGMYPAWYSSRRACPTVENVVRSGGPDLVDVVRVEQSAQPPTFFGLICAFVRIANPFARP